MSQTQYLLFESAGQTYGIHVNKIKRIIEMPKLTAVSCMPQTIMGLMNFRNKIVAIMDLRAIFHQKAGIATEEPCVILIYGKENDESQLWGLTADCVCEIRTFNEMVETDPEYPNREYLLGQYAADKKIVDVLDMNRIIATKSVAVESKGASEQDVD